MSAFFQTTTYHFVPSFVIRTALLLSLWGASIRFTTPLRSPGVPAAVFSAPDEAAAGPGAADIPCAQSTPRSLPLRRAPGTIFALFAALLLVPECDRPKMN